VGTIKTALSFKKAAAKKCLATAFQAFTAFKSF
jgi:hypothetical protein